MAATPNVRQSEDASNSPAARPITPRNGVVTLSGYGISVRVDRGHITLQDGVGQARRAARFSRVGHGLRRLVVVGNHGDISLAALRWLADQNATFSMLDRDGSVLVTMGPVRPSDARLRRAQALAQNSGTGLLIARHLIEQKLIGQEQVARAKLNATAVAEAVGSWRTKLADANCVSDLRFIEARAAAVYWSALSALQVRFPKQQLPRVPEHWRVFGPRSSPLTASPRLAVNPTNAILNYLYAVLASETRTAAAALGLDPGLGFLHLDTKARDSLAYDLMEPVRPRVDAYLVDFLSRQPLSREWFFELGNGNCRLMPGIISALSETCLQWGRLVAPFAEWVARTLWAAPRGQPTLPTRLTHSNKIRAQGAVPPTPTVPAPRFERVCAKCGRPSSPQAAHCPGCAHDLYRAEMIEFAKRGRELARTPEADAKRAERQVRQWAARRAWKPQDQPSWLTEQFYFDEIQPPLARVAVSRIAAALRVSVPYAADIRANRRKPHPRHWLTLSKLAHIRCLSEK
jgi:CRISPR-associated endonuclease Cas1